MRSSVDLLQSTARSWECEGCGVASIGLAIPALKLCLRCREVAAVTDAFERAAAGPALAELLAAAGVPWRFRRGWDRAAWCAAFQPWPQALDLWREKTEHAMVLLIGTTGQGKTGLATVLLAEALAAGATGRWVRAQDLVDAQQLSWDANRANRAEASRYATELLELERACREADVLVLDDLFAAARATPTAKERIHALVAARYDEGQRTVVTTNRGAGELAAILPSLASRLLSGLLVTIGDGPDRRTS